MTDLPDPDYRPPGRYWMWWGEPLPPLEDEDDE